MEVRALLRGASDRRELASSLRDARDDVVGMFAEYSGRWWIAGGWAIEAYTGVKRDHGDIDIGIPRDEFQLLTEHVRARFDVWAADRGTLRPVVAVEEHLSETCNNLWLRRSGADPWEYDVVLTTITDGAWIYRRDSRVGMSLADAHWQRDGVRYLRPEIQLLYKAPVLRSQDQEDFDASLPLLDAERQRWLRSALAAAHPGHPWIAALDE